MIDNLEPMASQGTLVFCAAGSPTVAALTNLIHGARNGDPLAPVDVVVPTAVAGVTLRRSVAGTKGLANVRFSTLPQLAERLAARHLALAPEPQRPLAAGDRAAAVRAVLATAEPSNLVNAACAQRATAQLIENVFAELDAVQVDPTDGPSGLGKLGSEILGLYGSYRAQVTGLLGRADLLIAAAEALAVGEGPQTHVVLMVHGRLTTAERHLVDALAQLKRLSVVAEQGAPTETLHYLADLLAEPVPTAAAAVDPNIERLILAPDADEEVRIAVRAVLAHLAATGCRPERIGIAYASSVPYVRLLAEQLSVAGIPHHVASQRTLAQTLAGRTIIGLLDLHARHYPRPDTLRWLADAPIVDANGKRVNAATWDRLSRDAGISRGVDTWRSRLERYAADQRGRATPEDSEDRLASLERRATQAEALLAQIEQIAGATTPVHQARTWAAAASALTALVERVLGGRKQVDGWSYRTEALAREVAIEQQSYDAIVAELAGLADLDQAGIPCEPGAIADVVADCLDAPVRSGTTLGRGVLTGPIASFAGADLDLLLVLGATEGALPARQREHTLLRDADRKLLSPELPTVGSRREAQRANWRLALAGAAAIRLSYPRADPRAQRRQFASPWYLEQATRLAGRTVSAADVDAAKVAADWFDSQDSFEASLRRATGYTGLHELDVLHALSGEVDGLAAEDSCLARGLAAARARGHGEFSEWTGATGPLPETLRQRLNMSATTLENWATCPTSHLYARVLGIRDLEDQGGSDTIDPRNRGTAVHEVLEELVHDHLPADGRGSLPTDREWSTDDVARAVALLHDKAEALTARGLTGRDVLWKAQLAKLTRMLARVLEQDSAQRRATLSSPLAVESEFGRNGAPPLIVDLPTQGAVTFGGSIDRVDSTIGGGLVVLDYKTGRGYGFEAIPKRAKASAEANLVDGGRKLQLVLYAMAARQLHGKPEIPVESWFWFVETGEMRGGPVTEVQEQQLRAALDIVVGGIRDGVYPLHPGEEAWKFGGQTWASCSYCPFDLVCPSSRAEQWNALRLDPAVRPYADLIYPPEVPA